MNFTPRRGVSRLELATCILEDDFLSLRADEVAAAVGMPSTFESAGVHDTLRAALAPHGGSDGRFDIDGSHFEMTPKQSLSMALTLHELGTNATKYGALSNDNGRVRISWHLPKASAGRQDLSFVWQESNEGRSRNPDHSRKLLTIDIHDVCWTDIHRFTQSKCPTPKPISLARTLQDRSPETPRREELNNAPLGA